MSGNTGDVGFPPYLENYHAEIMTGENPAYLITAASSQGTNDPDFGSTIDDEVKALVAGVSPYNNVSAYNPTDGITSTQSRLNTYTTLIDAMDDETDWNAYVTKALTRVDEIISPEDADIEEEMDLYDESSRQNLARLTSRFTAGMFDINAVVSTAFPAGMAIVESDFNTQLNMHRIQIKQQRVKERAIIILQSVDSMARLFNLKASGSATAIQGQDTVSKYQFAAQNDYEKQEIDFRIHDQMWKLDSLTRGASVIGAMVSIPIVPDKLTPFDKFVTGALNTAGIALQLGATNPALGALAGVTGLVLSGAQSGLFNS